MYEEIAALNNKLFVPYFVKNISDSFDIYSPCLHAGQFSHTYFAAKIDTTRLCVIKVVDSEDYVSVGKIKNEIRFQSKLSKLGIAPKISKLMVFEQQLAVTCELMKGCSLHEQLQKLHSIPEGEVRNVGQFLVDALGMIASNQIVYNGIDPSHVLVSVDDDKVVYKLSGFGNSKYISEEPEYPIEVKKEYASPEVLKDTKACSLASDIWSLGATLYKLATGLLPNHEFLTFPEELKLSREFQDLIKQCLQHDPKKRIRLLTMKKHPFFSREVRKSSSMSKDYRKDLMSLVKGLLEKRGLSCFIVNIVDADKLPYTFIKDLRRNNREHVYLCSKKVSEAKDGVKKFIIKEILVSSIHNPDLVELLVQELAILKLLANSPYSVPMVDYFLKRQKDVSLCLVLEYQNGDILASCIASRKLSLREIKLVLWNIARALRDAHSLNIIHRSVRPENILALQSEGQVVGAKLLNYGLGCITSKSGLVSEVVGTEGYVAPEVLAKLRSSESEDYTAKVDVWAFGALMHKLLVGATVYENRANTEHDHSLGMKVHLGERTEGPGVYVDLMEKCLNVDYYLRPTIEVVLAHEFFQTPLLREVLTYSEEAVRIGKQIADKGVKTYNYLRDKSNIPMIAKRIPKAQMADKKRRKTVYNEINAMDKLRHSHNAIKLYDYFTIDKDIYLIMEQVSTVTLSDYLRQCRLSRNLGERNTMMLELIKGLRYMHAHGVVHKALTPQSILLDLKANTMQVCRLRISNFCALEKNEDLKYFSAPEVAKGGKVTAEANVWSLGIIVYFTIFKKNMSDWMDIERMWEGSMALIESEENPKMAMIVTQCLAVEPSLRRTMDELYKKFVLHL
eukprot:TRINITY_DN1510_c0_g3_i2.p1 TRINITY_DN1510_c0_g3~~TRINITY_DN1510_c0_g3_i2.p1  ORF type:complete len:848 (-),score=222.92 TRINITY_DN1510_c0_g3_i2:142-2685(-)